MPKNNSGKPIRKQSRLEDTLSLVRAEDMRLKDKKRGIASNEERKKTGSQDAETMREIERVRARNEAPGRVFLLRPGIEERRHFGDEKSHFEIKVNSGKAHESFSLDSHFAFGKSGVPWPAAKLNSAKRKPLPRRIP
ncbi:MAG: hypothetical protein Q7R70_06735 [Candidatus Diapherotrites archaeon]|nr:hypothetical protein [Candidatus Diapherotrites archaeon]